MQKSDVIYFAIKDLIDKGELCVEYCNTENMILDFLTKPLQRKRILGM